MVCDVCGKNQATVHLTEIINDQMDELHLCEECARKKSLQMEQQFGLSDLLAGLAEFEKPAKDTTEPLTTKCPNCGLSYADFKKIGRLGCGECYATFKNTSLRFYQRPKNNNIVYAVEEFRLEGLLNLLQQFILHILISNFFLLILKT